MVTTVPARPDGHEPASNKVGVIDYCARCLVPWPCPTAVWSPVPPITDPKDAA